MSRNKIALFVLTAILTLNSQAWASRARVLVLGTGDPIGFLNGGSLLYEDEYNIFYNPSYINDQKNWAIIEKSNYNSASANTTAMGGFAAKIRGINMGLFLNRTESLASGATTGMNYANLLNMRPLEFYVGNDSGIKWGAGVQYASYTNATQTNSDITLRAGVQHRAFEPFAWLKVSGSEETSTPIIKHSSIGGGLRYHHGEWTPYFGIRQDEISQGTVSVKAATMCLGLTRNTKLSDSLRMIYGMGYFRKTQNSRNAMPIDFSVEANAASWVTLRGGLSYRLLDRLNGVTQADSTTGRLGTSFHFGKADLNWAVGGGGVAEAAGSLDTQAFDFGNGLFTAVSIAYRW